MVDEMSNESTLAVMWKSAPAQRFVADDDEELT